MARTIGLVKQIMSGYWSRRYDPQNSNGFPALGFGHDGILMGVNTGAHRDL